MDARNAESDCSLLRRLGRTYSGDPNFHKLEPDRPVLEAESTSRAPLPELLELEVWESGIPMRSVEPQCSDGIDARCAMRGNEARSQRDQHKRGRGTSDYRGIVTLQSKKKRLRKPTQPDGDHDPSGSPSDEHPDGLARTMRRTSPASAPSAMRTPISAYAVRRYRQACHKGRSPPGMSPGRRRSLRACR